MRTLKKLTMTLALLIMAVGGAWAANTYTITFAANGNTKTVENVTLPKTFQCSYENADGELDLILKELHGWSWTGNANQTFCDPETTPQSSDNNKVVAGNNNGDHYITIDNVFEGTVTITGNYVVNNNADKTYTLDISIAAVAPTEWDLTSQDGKTWTLANMPASNIELQVEYYAESNLFLSKNALADKTNIAVTAGDLGVQFGNDGKSANTITEGTPMTVKYNGTKKVIGFKVEKAAPATLIVNPVVGQIIGSDGKNYDANATLPDGVDKVAMIAYVSGSNGLALALTDIPYFYTWDKSGSYNEKKTAPEICSALNTSKAVTGGTWKLASQDEWKQMFSANGGNEESYTGLNTAIGNAGGTALQENEQYWSSSEINEYDAWLVNLADGNASWDTEGKHYGRMVRACLAF